MAQKIILASQSPRRKQLLEMAEYKFEVLIADVDETNPPGMPGEEVPLFLARKKADAVLHLVNDATVIAADTVVLLAKVCAVVETNAAGVSVYFCPFTTTLPLPPIALATVVSSERLKLSVPLLVTAPLPKLPLVPPLPICRVPALMVVPPE